jgi:hypothetical protein
MPNYRPGDLIDTPTGMFEVIGPLGGKQGLLLVKPISRRWVEFRARLVRAAIAVLGSERYKRWFA